MPGGYQKAKARALLLGCKMLGCDREAVYIGDHARDIEAGNTAECTQYLLIMVIFQLEIQKN